MPIGNLTCLLQLIVFLRESLDETGHLLLIVSYDGFLLLFNRLSDVSVEVRFLLVDEGLEMLEHAIHLLGELIQILIGLLLTLVKLHLEVFHVFLEVIYFLKTTANHVFLRLVSVERHTVDAEHAGDILELIVTEGARSVLLFGFKELRDAFLADRFVQMVENRFWEMDLAKIALDLSWLSWVASRSRLRLLDGCGQREMQARWHEWLWYFLLGDWLLWDINRFSLAREALVEGGLKLSRLILGLWGWLRSIRLETTLPKHWRESA